jgi:hypothetical protein
MHDVGDLMSEVGAALQFFDGFGENWQALEECLCYLDEWLPAEAYVVVVEHAEEMLAGDDDALRALLLTLDAAGGSWARSVDGPERFKRGPVPFHVLLNVHAAHPAAVERMLGLAESQRIAVRTDPRP